MFGHWYFGAEFFGPWYFGPAGDGGPPPPPPSLEYYTLLQYFDKRVDR